jgi:hypothetical protein
MLQMSIYKKLLDIQSELKAPKNQFNKFGGYNYRSCEDILEGVKPLLKEHNTTLMIHDQIVNIGSRYYICATVTFIDIESGEKIMCEGLAREEESKKGMDGSQVTGAASSYARKYALNGLFCIDDTKDSDATNSGDKPKKEPYKAPEKPKDLPPVFDNSPTFEPDVISIPQAKRIFALSGGDEGIVRMVLKRYKYESSKNIKKKEYEKICKEVEQEKKRLDALEV